MMDEKDMIEIVRILEEEANDIYEDRGKLFEPLEVLEIILRSHEDYNGRIHKEAMAAAKVLYTRQRGVKTTQIEPLQDTASRLIWELDESAKDSKTLISVFKVLADEGYPVFTHKSRPAGGSMIGVIYDLMKDQKELMALRRKPVSPAPLLATIKDLTAKLHRRDAVITLLNEMRTEGDS